MAKFLLTLALVAASNVGAVSAAGADEAGLAQRRETMAEVIRVFSNPVLAAAADAETTRRSFLFVQRELGPLRPLIDAVVDMPEDSAADVRSKVEAIHAVQQLMIQHFRPLLMPHRRSGKPELDGLFMQLAEVTNKTRTASVEDL